MSHLGKPDFDELVNQLRHSLSYDDNKPDFHELDLGSPVSPLRTGKQGLTMTTTTTTTTTSSSSSSSKSVSGRNSSNPTAKRSEPAGNYNNHSGELSGSSETSPTTASTGNIINWVTQTRSKSITTVNNPLIYLGQSTTGTVNSPPVNVLPTGNICPSGKIIKTGMAANRSSRTDVLGTGSGNYGHGSIMRGGGVGTGPVTPSKGYAFDSGNSPMNTSDLMRKTMGSLEPEEVKRAGNEMYKKGQFLEALSLYDKAIALSPANAAYWSNRAAALTALGRVGEAVKECEEAVRLDPNYGRAHQRLASLFLRVGHVENARKHLCFPGQPQDPTELQKL